MGDFPVVSRGGSVIPVVNESVSRSPLGVGVDFDFRSGVEARSFEGGEPSDVEEVVPGDARWAGGAGNRVVSLGPAACCIVC